MPSPTSFGDVSLADLIRMVSQASIAAPAGRFAWAVECLGLPHDWRETPISHMGTEPHSSIEAGNDKDPSAPSKDEGLHSQEAIHPVSEEEGPLPYVISGERREPATSGDPSWLRDARLLPPAQAARVQIRPPLPPLFPLAKTRALLSTALATPRGEGSVDMDQLIARVAHQRPLLSIPRCRHSTLRLGVQLLIDLGDGMLPFARDQQELIEAILNVVGRDRVETLRFADNPTRGLGPRSRRTWRRHYDPPPPGTPVVLLTDLGIASQRQPDLGAPVEEWLKFARVVHAADCPLLALVPYARTRWPSLLRSAMHILPWDRGTTVSAVRRVVGRGLENTPIR